MLDVSQKKHRSREKYPTRKIRLVGQAQADLLLRLIPQLPIDSDRPLEIIIREEVKARKMDQQALMWVGPLADIAEQAYVGGRTYSAEIWHEHFKEQFLPDLASDEMTKDSYKKYDYLPTGDRVLVGSTTQLTVRGFAMYLEQVIADGAGMGVMFSERREK